MSGMSEDSSPYSRIGKPRDPERIEKVLNLIRASWEAEPQLRLGQLLCIVASTDQLFYLEDAELLDRLQHYDRHDK